MSVTMEIAGERVILERGVWRSKVPILARSAATIAESYVRERYEPNPELALAQHVEAKMPSARVLSFKPGASPPAGRDL